MFIYHKTIIVSNRVGKRISVSNYCIGRSREVVVVKEKPVIQAEPKVRGLDARSLPREAAEMGRTGKGKKKKGRSLGFLGMR